MLTGDRVEFAGGLDVEDEGKKESKMVPRKLDEVTYAYKPSTQEAGTRGKGV